jgi:ElaB/YqjD/DUF883 family membrane-anchored ribosome-binding protein
MSTTAEQLTRRTRRKAPKLSKFADEMEELLGRVSHLEDADLARLRNRVDELSEKGKEAATEGVRRAFNGTRKATLATYGYVRENPWKVIGATAAVAILVGALLRRNSPSAS